MEELIPTLKKLKDIPNINRGGCGHTAKYLAKHIRKKYAIEAKVVFLLDEDDVDNLRRGKHYACVHALVKVGDILYDANGAHPVSYLDNIDYLLERVMNKQELQRSLKSPYWNPVFSINDISKIKRILQ